ncbi:protein FAR1-RELATED SEQUENCE 3-like [Phalaenopsis equestris]|uniref:protein FAR1-RELATED SEQUENCE 3-like n=1 Tax=Phalaenopsis equestris TaxID=78828 RepID=UPI0009E4A288|nr:protein FAR1-RELATED SEQUENCE 3-like [Phalaenopsis equestris]
MTSCQTMIQYVIDVESNWTVKKFVESHNRPLTETRDKYFLRSGRKISEINADVLRSMTGSVIRATNAFNFIATEVREVENMKYMKRDAYNFIQGDRRDKIEHDDANSLLQLFMERQAEDNMFSWDFQTDKNGRVTSFFWSDGISKLDYDSFGDVIIFLYKLQT